jgi:hypothetical protein
MIEPEFNDEQMIKRYLLGELPETEQGQLEDRAFSNGDYLQHVKSVEKDLIDEYVRGEMSGKEKDAFERHFLASEKRRRQIEFARVFARVTNEDSLNQGPATISSWWNSFRRRSNLAVSFSLAAIVLIVVIGGLWFIRQSTQSRREQAQAQPTQPPAQVTQTAQQNATPAGDQHPQNEAQPTPLPAIRPEVQQTQRPVIASLMLLPGTSRGADNRPQLRITAGTNSAQLRTSSGRAVRSQSGLTAHPGRGGREVVLTLPANLLVGGDYELTLNGVNEQKQTEPLGYYYFSVRKE